SEKEKHEGAGAEAEDDEVHDDEEQLVVPALGALAPEAGLPHEDFFLDGAEHDEDEADGGPARENSGGQAESAGQFSDPKEQRHAFAQADAFGASFEMGDVAPAAETECGGQHQAHEEQSHAGVGSEDWRDVHPSPREGKFAGRWN